MCGLAGFWGPDALRRTAWMTRFLAHRGPDEEGTWASPCGRLALGNRRLRILDLSPSGHQPMSSKDGLFSLTFNGEIYNYLELRHDLQHRGHAFRSQSDTEVLLAALIEWGIDALEHLNGMYAFAFWDGRSSSLLLARDRLGIKPLYYATRGDSFSFASEIKSILAAEIVEPEIAPASLESYLRLLWVPDPNTLFRGIMKVPPGSVLNFSERGLSLSRYWDVPSPDEATGVGLDRAAEELLAALSRSINRQLRSDVPVGVLLSGGLDSTTILSLAARETSRDIRSYSIGFRSADRKGEAGYEDVRYARGAAKGMGITHEELLIEPSIVDLLPRLVYHLEDPVADSSAINSFLICKAARATSTVLLSGSGADELFGGYRKYVSTVFADEYQRLPKAIRSGLFEPIIARLPVSVGRFGLRSVRFAKKFLRYAGAPLFDRFLGYSTYYDAGELEALLGGDPGEVSNHYVGVEALVEAWNRRDTGDVVDRMTYVDLKYYLPGLALAYMDKASMAASSEVRVPLIDDEVVDFVARLGGSFKVKGLCTKVLLRHAVRGIVPEGILARPKAPFGAPLRNWLRHDLLALVEEYLSPARILGRGLLSPTEVYRLLREHRSGHEDHSLRIWALLTLEAWLREFFDTPKRFRMGGDEISLSRPSTEVEKA